jgi:hypothetical protein
MASSLAGKKRKKFWDAKGEPKVRFYVFPLRTAHFSGACLF